jgi:tetratricopeptide (TPR) repeat protein
MDKPLSSAGVATFLSRSIAAALLGLALSLPVWPAQPQQGQPLPPSGASSQAAQSPQQDSSTYDPLPAEKDVEVGTFYMRKGDIDAAITRFQDAVRLRPNFAKARQLLGEAYEKKGDRAAAVKCYREYLQVFPDAPDAKKIQKKIEKLSATKK